MLTNSQQLKDKIDSAATSSMKKSYSCHRLFKRMELQKSIKIKAPFMNQSIDGANTVSLLGHYTSL